ncbi:hypothetical protein CRENBAI_005340 [Crenichthys baileyi]|uniref:Uncharacterized protein n=1 Tax=Crenichthys baileyi TaxID=28760 RepID=A0AAV9QWZ6_9TELE
MGERRGRIRLESGKKKHRKKLASALPLRRTCRTLCALKAGTFGDSSPAETKGEAPRRCCQRPSRGEGENGREREGAERRNIITLAGRELKRRG